MIHNLGRALRRTAGGSVIFVLGIGAVGSQPPQVLTSAASTLALTSATKNTNRPVTQEWASPRDEHLAVMEAHVAYHAAVEAALVTPQPAIRQLTTTSRRHALVAHAAALPTAPPAAEVAVAAQPPTAVAPAPGNSAGYAFGYCTWWVSHKRSIPWHGMAAQWWSLARAYGFAEGSTPRVGAVMVMGYGMAGASASSGHVAYVESVNPNGSFTISEMNWWGVAGGGYGKVDYRTITSLAGVLGFIY